LLQPTSSKPSLRHMQGSIWEFRRGHGGIAQSSYTEAGGSSDSTAWRAAAIHE
jgi:hypothetical protein